MMGLGYLMEVAACLVKGVCHGASTARRTQRETGLDSGSFLSGLPRM